MKQVVLIEVIENGSDVALFLDGDYIISADPGAGDDVSQVLNMAKGLAAHFMVDLVKHEYKAAEDWQWNEVQQDLINKEIIISQDKWNRDDIQFARFTNSLNGYEHRDHVVQFMCESMELKAGDVLEILDQAASTMVEINGYIFKGETSETETKNTIRNNSASGNFILNAGITGDDQEGSFQNACLSTNLEGYAVSIAISPHFPDECLNQDDASKHLIQALTPLCEIGWDVEVQIGPDS